MAIKYKELAAVIASMNEEQLNSDVTVYVDDEFRAVFGVAESNEENCTGDVLDPGHPFLYI